MQLDLVLPVAGLLVGFLVGLTGMGGGALMTPVLIVVFGVQPLAAVSSDLVASLFMKPVGAAVHFRRGTVDRSMVLWLMVGSVPSAFAGVFILRWLGRSHDIQQVVQAALAAALIFAAAAMLARGALRNRKPGSSSPAAGRSASVRPLATVLVGAIAGVVVGMTSVGSGSLVIVALMFVYPWLPLKRLVGTDITQAIPLVASAALAHVLFGDFRLSVALPILVGAIPGVYIGARLSSRASSTVLNPVLAAVLLASGLKLLGVGIVWIGALIAFVAAVGLLRWSMSRRSRTADAHPSGAVTETT